MERPIVNVADLQLLPRPPALAPSGAAAERYDARVGLVGRRIGAKKLGCNVTAIPPGKRAFPFHNHLANEEMFFVLSGTGEIRIGEKTYPIREGDVIACPAGGRETAHQIANTGAQELRYLAVSTMISPEVVEYPDGGSFGVLAERVSPDGVARRDADVHWPGGTGPELLGQHLRGVPPPALLAPASRAGAEI